MREDIKLNTVIPAQAGIQKHGVFRNALRHLRNLSGIGLEYGFPPARE